jgi:hypothetical protein
MAERDNLPVFHCERGTPSAIADRVMALLETGSFVETREDAQPWWLVDPTASFEQALEGLPDMVRLYFTRGLEHGRALRWALFEREPALAIWAADFGDPLLQRALERAPDLVLARLAQTPAAAELRERLLASHPVAVARSLVGVSGDAADRMREQLVEHAPGAVLESLAGRTDAFALALRRRLWSDADVHERAIGLRDCDDPDAWERRERLLAKDPAIVLPTLCQLAPERVDPILHRYTALAPKSVLAALRGRADDGAHRLREQLLDTGRELVDSLASLDDPGSWALRERYCERWPAAVVSSLLGIPVDDRIRDLIARCRAAAPGDLFLLRGLELFDRLSLTIA